MASNYSETIKTRICIISDTHGKEPRPSDHKNNAFRNPLPKADVLIHAGDLTFHGELHEHESTIDMLKEADAELKIVIGGNHDITLDEDYMEQLNSGKHSYYRQYKTPKDELAVIKDLYCGDVARNYGIRYLEEGVQTFTLKNGAKLTVYASPWTPEHGILAWAYPRQVDRYNPSPPVSRFKAPNPVPSFPEIDVMITHGPPYGILDYSVRGHVNAGCPHLRRAVKRCRPRVHCFGHIHEGWGAQRMDWKRDKADDVQVSERKMLSERSAHVDLSHDSRTPLKFGEETLFVNASIMDAWYSAKQAPWVLDLDLRRDFDQVEEEGTDQTLRVEESETQDSEMVDA